MRINSSMEEIRITVPGPGLCFACATKHDAADPHEKNSLYYMYWFHRRYKRLPTWKDAMSHCSIMTQIVWTEKLQARGIAVEALPDGE